jgi:hypothetical protein
MSVTNEAPCCTIRGFPILSSLSGPSTLGTLLSEYESTLFP